MTFILYIVPPSLLPPSHQIDQFPHLCFSPVLQEGHQWTRVSSSVCWSEFMICLHAHLSLSLSVYLSICLYTSCYRSVMLHVFLLVWGSPENSNNKQNKNIGSQIILVHSHYCVVPLVQVRSSMSQLSDGCLLDWACISCPAGVC